MPFFQGGALGLDGVVDDATGPPGEVHGNQGVLRYASLFGGQQCGWRVMVVGWGLEGGGIQEKGWRGSRQGSRVKQTRHTHWSMTNPVCTQTHFSHTNAPFEEKHKPLLDIWL